MLKVYENTKNELSRLRLLKLTAIETRSAMRHKTMPCRIHWW